MIGLPLTPDGARYLSLAQGKPMPWPFCLRQLLPRLCGSSARLWRIASWVGVIGMAVGTAALVGGVRGIAAGLMVAALPMNRLSLRYPVLVDAPAMALAVSAAACWHHGWLLPAMVLAILAGLTKETAPLFAAVYAGTPVLAAALLAPVIVAMLGDRGPDVPGMDRLGTEALSHPFRVGIRLHTPRLFDPFLMLLPWGTAVVGLLRLDGQVGSCLALAYAQLCVATDSVRLYQWAAPLLCGAAAQAVPEAVLPLLVAGVWWNPWAGDGS